MIANVKLSVGGKTFLAGEKIDRKLKPSDERFLLREGYIAEEEKNGAAAGNHVTKQQSGQSTDATEASPKNSGGKAAKKSGASGGK